jgi:hypothetical protein
MTTWLRSGRLRSVWAVAWAERRYWLAPLVLTYVLFAVFVLMTRTSSVASFVYANF